MKVRGYGRNCRIVLYVTEEWRDGLVALAEEEGISTSDLRRRLVGKSVTVVEQDADTATS